MRPRAKRKPADRASQLLLTDRCGRSVSQFDFTTTGRLIEFDLELEDGFKLEIER